MKKITLLAVLFSFFLLNPQLSQDIFGQSIECSTEATPEEMERREATQGKFELYKADFTNQMTNKTVVQVPVKVHIARTSNGTGGISEAVIEDAFSIANDYYSHANIEFYFCGDFNYIDDDFVYDWLKVNDSELVDIDVENIINIYFVNSVTSTSGDLICGYAKFPSAGIDHIVMENGCTSNGSTLSHELGHYFGVWHTHETFVGDELVDGSNCLNAGDLLCDTPADPKLGSSNVNSNCCYSDPNTTDANGDFYTPDVGNIMSYSRKECRDHFSNDQYALIAYTLEHERDYLECNEGPMSSNDCQDFEAYSAAGVTTQSPRWYLLTPTSGDAYVTSAIPGPNSSKSLKVDYQPSPSNVVFDISNANLFFSKQLYWDTYVPSNRSGYYCVRHSQAPGGVAFEVFFNQDVSGNLSYGNAFLRIAGSTDVISFEIPLNQWFQVVHTLDFVANEIMLVVNGHFVYNYPVNIDLNGLEGVNFFALNSHTEFFVDNLCFGNLDCFPILLLAPVCANGHEFPNGQAAECFGITEYTDGECSTGDVLFDIGEECGAQGQVVEVPVRVRNFQDVTSFQFSIHVANPAVAQIIGVTGFNLPIANGGLNFFGNGELRTCLWYEPQVNGVSLVDNTILFYLKVELVGSVGFHTSLYIDDYPTDFIVGAPDEVPAIALSGNVCIQQSEFTISGNVYKESGQPVALANVVLSGAANDQVTTNTTGYYEFKNLTGGQNYTVTPEKNTNIRNGVNVLDITKIKDHILGQTLLTSPYQHIAADADNSRSINVIDITSIKDVVLTSANAFPNNTSWRFVPADYVFQNPANPLIENFPESRAYNPLQGDMINEDYIAIKVGDVNDSCDPAQDSDSGEKSETTFNFNIDDKAGSYGDLISVPFYGAGSGQLIAFQFTLEYNKENLDFLGVEQAGLPGFDEGAYYLLEEEGKVTFAWVHPQALVYVVNEEEVMFGLKFQLKESVSSLEGLLRIVNVPTEAIAFNELQEALQIELQINEISTGVDWLNPMDKVSLINFPNPFKQQTTIRFNLPVAMDVSLSIHDATGVQVFLLEDYFSEGWQEVVFADTAHLPGGIYYYSLRTADYCLSQSMLLSK